MTVATDTPSIPTPAPAPKKSSLLKKLVKLAAVLVVLLVIGVVVLFLNLNSLVKAGVIRGGQYATDQNTDLALADLSLSGGVLKLDGLGIENLQDYSKGKIIAMKSCVTTVNSGSLFTDTVEVTSIVIDGLEVTLEQKGFKNNLNELLEIINKKTASTGNAQNTSPGKKLKIGKVTLTGTKVHVRSDVVNLDLNLPDLEMVEPTNPDGRPMKIADLIGKIVVHLGKEIVENPQIPGDIKGAMKNVTAVVDKLKGELEKNVKTFGDLGKGLENVGKNLDPSKLQDATKGLQDAGKGLGDMFNKKAPAK